MNMCGGGDGLGAPGFSVSRGAPDSQDGGEVSDLFSRFFFVQRGLWYFLENVFVQRGLIHFGTYGRKGEGWSGVRS